MFKEKFNPFEKPEGGQGMPKQEKPEPVFATEEELAEKEKLVKQLREVEKDRSERGLMRQRRILSQLGELDKRRTRRVEEMPFEELPKSIRGSIQKDVESFQEIYGLNNIKKKIEAHPLLKKELEKIKELQEKDSYLELHYLPELEITEDTKFPDNFTEFPPKIFEWRNKGSIEPKSLKIEGGYILIDSRSRPEINLESKELYENDQILEEVIKGLREKKEIEQYEKGLIQSRDPASYQEVKEKILPQYSKELNLEEHEARLPKFLELYLIGNLYHRQWNEAKTCEWVEDEYNRRFAHSRPGLAGALYVKDGLFDVNRDNLDSHSTGRAFRPLVDLGK